MIVRGIKTNKVLAGKQSIFDVLDAHVPKLTERSVVCVTSKIVSLCEGRVVSVEGTDKDDLIKQQSAYYVPRENHPNHITLTIAHGLLCLTAGIDQSNGDGHYILWPADPQASANSIREYLVDKHGVKEVGVILTDSTTRPLHWGTTGIAIAHSGFEAIVDYKGQEDLFGRPFHYQKSSVLGGLAAAGVTVMGEGNQQMPLAVIEDVPFVAFQQRSPTKEEVDQLHIPLSDDYFAPVLNILPWQKGDLER